jgi:uncharacterized membrane protein (DUF4010 family)
MAPELSVYPLVSAIGLGLLIGVVRERAHPDPQHSAAGIRTHLMVALAGALGAALGTAVLVVVLLVTGALAVASYLRSARHDPGLTGEFALPVTALLAALAQTHPGLAAGLSVIVAAALFAKQPLHRLVRERMSESELQDALLLAAAALVVLPLLPDTAVDPWGALVPSRLWKLVVLILAAGMTGHLMFRLVGARWGLPLAGFLSGFASSTAAVAAFGQRARAEASHASAAAAGALCASVGSVALLAGLVATAAPALMRAVAAPLAVAGVAMVAAAGAGILRRNSLTELPSAGTGRAFRLSHAVMLAALMGVLLLISSWLRQQYGSGGVLVAAGAVALVEVHAAGAALAQLAAAGQLDNAAGTWGVLLLLTINSLAKSGIAFVSGGARYGWQVSLGLLGASVLAALTLILLYYI